MVKRAWGRRVEIALVVLALSLVGPARAAAANLWVDGSNPACSDAQPRQQVTEATPWCSIAVAALGAQAGDVVLVMPGRYVGAVRPAASGSVDAPIRYVAPAGDVTIDGAGASVALKVIGVSSVQFDGFTITGASSQGVYMDSASNVTLSTLAVVGNGGHGVQLRATGATVTDSTIAGNGMAGIFELPGASGNTYSSNTISGNGKDANPYSGDGIQLNGSRATVRGNTITDNGDPGPYEHGIYASASSSEYLIESNSLSGNAASDIKAAGSGGTIRYNWLSDSRLGLLFSDNDTPVTAYYNVIAGRFQHAVFFTSDKKASQGRLWNNTIIETGRLTSAGDASAVFVNSAALVDIRNNLICYTNPDNLGVALWVNSASLVTSLLSDTNWLCSTDPSQRNFAWNGSRTTRAGWQAATGQDQRSVSTRPPAFDSSYRVTSKNFGQGHAQPLGLAHDYAGTPVPSRGIDIGAYQTTS